MDPEATLTEIRGIIRAHVLGRPIDADRLCDLVEALDEWITGGGYLPREWHQPCDCDE